jgi:hypothetical protein
LEDGVSLVCGHTDEVERKKGSEESATTSNAIDGPFGGCVRYLMLAGVVSSYDPAGLRSPATLCGRRQKSVVENETLGHPAATMMVAMSVASQAFAHHCTNVNKKAGAGSVGTVNIATGEETITKKNGGFITITNGSTFSYDVFAHRTLPDGAMAAGPERDSECDGRGIDDALACEGTDK